MIQLVSGWFGSVHGLQLFNKDFLKISIGKNASEKVDGHRFTGTGNSDKT